MQNSCQNIFYIMFLSCCPYTFVRILCRKHILWNIININVYFEEDLSIKYRLLSLLLLVRKMFAVQDRIKDDNTFVVLKETDELYKENIIVGFSRYLLICWQTLLDYTYIKLSIQYQHELHLGLHYQPNIDKFQHDSDLHVLMLVLDYHSSDIVNVNPLSK